MAYTVWENLDQVGHYARSRYKHWDQRWLNHREQRLVRRLFAGYGLHGTILDAPVGYGRFQTILGEFGETYALDFNYFAALYQLKRLGLAQGSVTGAAEQLPFQNNSFDVVFSFRLLQHMHESGERRAIFSEFGRVSRKWVIVSLYLASPLHLLHRRIVKQPSRITMLTRRAMLNEATGAGLELVQTVPVLRGLHAHHICLFRVPQTA